MRPSACDVHSESTVISFHRTYLLIPLQHRHFHHGNQVEVGQNYLRKSYRLCTQIARRLNEVIKCVTEWKSRITLWHRIRVNFAFKTNVVYKTKIFFFRCFPFFFWNWDLWRVHKIQGFIRRGKHIRSGNSISIVRFASGKCLICHITCSWSIFLFVVIAGETFPSVHLIKIRKRICTYGMNALNNFKLWRLTQYLFLLLCIHYLYANGSVRIILLFIAQMYARSKWNGWIYANRSITTRHTNIYFFRYRFVHVNKI